MDIILNPQFLDKKEQILEVVKIFFDHGDDLVKGARNTIKVHDFEGNRVTVKYFKKLGLLKALVYSYFRLSKAKRSFDYANYLLENKVNTPFPIAYIEDRNIFRILKDSYYICDYVPYDFTIRELIHNPLFEDREEILRQFTRFTFSMHEARVNFLDHSPGNTLIKKIDANTYEFYLIDLNRMKFQTLTIEQRMDNFKKMWLSKTMVRIIASEYALLFGADVKILEEILMQKSQDFKRRITRKKWLKRKLKK